MNESTQNVLNFQKSLQSIQKTFGSQTPDCTLVLGSGLNQVIESFHIEKTISYSDIPHFPKSHLQGHAGKLHLAKIHDKTALIFSGRFHHYQGIPNTIAAAPAWISGFWKIPLLIATNASGGISTSFKAGDLALIRDHIFLQGDNPLRGVTLPEWENPFVDMTKTYDEKFCESLLQTAKQINLKLHQGVYMCITGPTFETPSEIKVFEKMGADMVGMSTIPEVIVARRMSMKVVGISMIANAAAGVASPDQLISHQDVIDSVQKNQGNVGKLLSSWFKTKWPA